MSRRQRHIKEWEFAKPIKIEEPKKLYRKAGEVFDTWWVLVQVYIEDQPERFPKDERTIDWIGSLMDSYAASWHIQWLKGTLNGTHPKLVLATGPGNPPAVQFLTGGYVRFGSLPGQKPEPLCLGGFVTWNEPKPCVFWPGRNQTAGPFCGSYIFGSN